MYTRTHVGCSGCFLYVLRVHYLACVSMLGISSVELTVTSLLTSATCAGTWDGCSSVATVAMVASVSATAATVTDDSLREVRAGVVPGATTSAVLQQTQIQIKNYNSWIISELKNTKCMNIIYFFMFYGIKKFKLQWHRRLLWPWKKI